MAISASGLLGTEQDPDKKYNRTKVVDKYLCKALKISWYSPSTKWRCFPSPYVLIIRDHWYLDGQRATQQVAWACGATSRVFRAGNPRQLNRLVSIPFAHPLPWKTTAKKGEVGRGKGEGELLQEFSPGYSCYRNHLWRISRLRYARKFARP